MVAYSFKKRFVQPIRAGLSKVSLSFDCRPKRQTIRAHGRRRHARPTEDVQLYTAMRTKQCELLGVGRCIGADDLQLDVRSLDHFGVRINGGNWMPDRKLRQFAMDDGFDDEVDMYEFWQTEHQNVTLFDGVLIRWEPQ